MLAWNPWIIRSVASVAVLISIFGPRGIQAQPGDEEYRVKAAFIFHFAELVDWPEEALQASPDSLFICTLGTDPFQGALESVVAGKTIRSRVIAIRHLKAEEEIPGCNVLFLGKMQSKQIPMLLADLHNAPVLTVGETDGFLGVGGMICFVLEGNNVRFQINLDAAESAKLQIGSRLLFLARSVIGESRAR